MSATKMNGAESLVRTLIDGGIEVCFTNPGTSEMHFCAALDRVPGLRCVLGLFEGVVTGAADGYGRMRDFPSATLLYTGPGLGNGLANLHNARKARSPVVNIVGEHATYHIRHDAPLLQTSRGLPPRFRTGSKPPGVPRRFPGMVHRQLRKRGRLQEELQPSSFLLIRPGIWHLLEQPFRRFQIRRQ